MSDVSAAAAARELDTRWLGRTHYEECLSLQRALHAKRIAGEAADTLLLTEHEPVFTLGRCGGAPDPTIDPAYFQRAGMPLVSVERGGNITYHGPGQLVAYPILNLRELGLSAIDLVDALELASQAVFREYGVQPERVPRMRGLWVEGQKIASVGIYVSRGVSMHGVALNIAPDLSHFALINPCGLDGVSATSLVALTGNSPSTAEAAASFAREFALLTGIEARTEQLCDDNLVGEFFHK